MKNLKKLSFILTGSIAIGLASCAEKEVTETYSEPSPFATVSDKMTFKIDTLFTDFESPWGMTWLPDGRMLVTERKGEILVFKDDKFTGEKLTGVPEVHEINQAGLLDITIHPNYASNGWIYLSYARPEGEGDVLVITRAKLDGNNMHSVEENLYVVLSGKVADISVPESYLTMPVTCISPMETKVPDLPMPRNLTMTMAKSTESRMMAASRKTIHL